MPSLLRNEPKQKEKSFLYSNLVFFIPFFRYWEKEGICWARNSEVQDIDDTAMGFRLLRLYGHEVSPGK